MWTDEVHLSVRFSSRYLILSLVRHISSNIEFVLVCVYGDPHHRSTYMIWEHIANFVYENLGKPVMCIGDLNNIMCEIETTSTKVNYNRMRAFNDYVKQCGLVDMGFSGPAYTWSNKRLFLCLKGLIDV